MTNENLLIELVEPAEGSWPRVAPAGEVDQLARTTLLSERMGLLAGRASSPSRHDDRRMEDWIASHLDLGEITAHNSRSPWACLSKTSLA